MSPRSRAKLDTLEAVSFQVGLLSPVLTQVPCRLALHKNHSLFMSPVMSAHVISPLHCMERSHSEVHSSTNTRLSQICQAKAQGFQH